MGKYRPPKETLRSLQLIKPQHLLPRLSGVILWGNCSPEIAIKRKNTSRARGLETVTGCGLGLALTPLFPGVAVYLCVSSGLRCLTHSTAHPLPVDFADTPRHLRARENAGTTLVYLVSPLLSQTQTYFSFRTFRDQFPVNIRYKPGWLSSGR